MGKKSKATGLAKRKFLSTPVKKVFKDKEGDGSEQQAEGQNIPKRAIQNPYFLYLGEQVEKMRKENKAVKITYEVKRNISKCWDAMTVKEKMPYLEMANVAKEANKDAKRQYSEFIPQKPRKKAKTEEYTINTRVSLPAIMDTVRSMTEDQKEAVKNIGFGGLLELNCSHLDREICGWLVRNFDPTKCTLNVHNREVAITPVDVEKILGIRAVGNLVKEKGSMEDISELCKQYGFVDGILKVSRLREDLRSMVDAGDEFRVRFALLALGCICCPSTKDGIKTSLMHIVKDASSLGTKNWGRFLLDNLGTGVRNYKEKNTGGSYVSGCVFFLMLFYFEHFIPVGAPSPSTNLMQSLPRLRIWGNSEIKDRCRFIYDRGLLSKEKVELEPLKEVEDVPEARTTTPSTSTEQLRFTLIQNELKDIKDQLSRATTSILSDFNAFKEEIRESVPKLVREITEKFVREVLQTSSARGVDKDAREHVDQLCRATTSILSDFNAFKEEIRESLPKLVRETTEKVVREVVKNLQTSSARGVEKDAREHVDVGSQKRPSEEPGVDVQNVETEDCLHKASITPPRTDSHVKENTERTPDAAKKDKDAGEHSVLVLSDSLVGIPKQRDADHDWLRTPFAAKINMSENASSPHGKVMLDSDEDSPDTGTQLKEPLKVETIPIEIQPDKHAANPCDEHSICPKMTTRGPLNRGPSKYLKSPYFKFEKVASKKAPLTSEFLENLPIRKVHDLLKDNPVLKLTVPEFNLFEKKIIKFVFDSNLPGSDILVRSNIDHADRHNLKCLKEGVWVNDMVINCIVGKLTYRARKKFPADQQERWFMPTFVAQKAIYENEADARITGMHFFGRDRYTGDVKFVKKIFCPINQNNTHWFCCMIDMVGKKVNIYDSLFSPTANQTRSNMVKKLVDHLDEALSCYYGSSYDMAIKEFKIHRCTWVPQQTNSDDCGIYTVNFMYVDNFIPGVVFLFKPAEARNKILIDLIQSKYNTKRDEVLAEVESYNADVDD